MAKLPCPVGDACNGCDAIDDTLNDDGYCIACAAEQAAS